MNERMRSLLHIDSSMDSTTILTRLLVWAVVLSVSAWVVIGLVSLRFDLTGGLEDVFYSQLIIAGIFGIAIANAFIMGAGGFGGSGVLAKTPILWGLLSIVGMFMLVWQVWVDFEGGSNEVLKVMYSLLGVGLCGTYAGFISLPSIERTYRLLRWAMFPAHGRPCGRDTRGPLARGDALRCGSGEGVREGSDRRGHTARGLRAGCDNHSSCGYAGARGGHLRGCRLVRVRGGAGEAMGTAGRRTSPIRSWGLVIARHRHDGTRADALLPGWSAPIDP